MTGTAHDDALTSVVTREVRVLEGPNLYFTRPALKVVLTVPGYLDLELRGAAAVARRAGLTSARPGPAGTSQRQRFVMRLVAHVCREIGAASGVTRLAVRARAGGSLGEIVVAIPWRRRGRALALGERLGPLLISLLEPTCDGPELIAQAGAAVRVTEPGAPAAVLSPTVPVVAITGTNGKTTTTRMVAHLVMTAGLRTAWSSTDGVVVMGELVEPGDYSGPGGAREVLATPGLDVGILETARGGMLLKGMGVRHTDVTVVTNVAADHLGLQGIDTLDQLAEVKAIPTLIAKPQGWVVLNGDDPRVWAMRLRTKARVWAFSLDPDSPALREAIAGGGRGMTVLDGQVVALRHGADPDRLVRVVDVPLTLAGLSSINVANALGAAAAGLALGLPRSAVVEGLRTFTPDPQLNSGRLNCYSVPIPEGIATVVIDMAHNEAGLEALLQVCRGLAAPGGRVHLGIGGTGDRLDGANAALGEIAGHGADHVVLSHKLKYLRGMTLEHMDGLLRAGLARAGVHDVAAYVHEIEALGVMLDACGGGDVVGLMCHDSRPAVQELIAARGGTVDDAGTIRRKVVAAAGQHELEDDLAAIAAMSDLGEREVAAGRLAAAHPTDARLVYEWARAVHAIGEDTRALELYLRAAAAGLGEPHRHLAQLDAATVCRALGRPAQALELADAVLVARPGHAVARALKALALLDLGQSGPAVAELLEAMVDQASDADSTAYRAVLRVAATEVRGR
ncbi:MAG: tetratricopeptide repeat protein [Candidatus Phosphoribacter sp.]